MSHEEAVATHSAYTEWGSSRTDQLVGDLDAGADSDRPDQLAARIQDRPISPLVAVRASAGCTDEDGLDSGSNGWTAFCPAVVHGLAGRVWPQAQLRAGSGSWGNASPSVSSRSLRMRLE